MVIFKGWRLLNYYIKNYKLGTYMAMQKEFGTCFLFNDHTYGHGSCVTLKAIKHA